jgi:hypothetical protein
MVDGMIAIHQRRFEVPHLEFLLAEGIVVGPRTVEATLPDGRLRRFVADRLFLISGRGRRSLLCQVLPTPDR